MSQKQFWSGLVCGVAVTLLGSQLSVFRPAAATEGSAGIPALVASAVAANAAVVEAPMLYELRTYTAPEGKLDALNARFREHTMRLFEKHGMKNIIYWTPTETPNTLIYVIAHKDMDAAKASWAAFRDDPEWKKVAEETQKNGKIVSKVEAVYLNPTDYSPMK